MTRPQCKRKISDPPLMEGFKPFGISKSQKETVSLLFEEYEAIRLTDYEGLKQEEAAERMQVSRPTFTRIYEKARHSVAQALVEGKILVINGGNVQFNGQWFRCKRCHKLIDGVENHIHCANCPHYGQDELEKI